MKTDWLEKLCLYFPNKVAMKEAETGRALTYQEFQNCASRLANVFTNELGLKRGDRVAILAENSLEHFILFFVAQKTGLVVAPLNYRLAAREIDDLLSDCEPSLVVVQEKFEPLVAQSAFKPRHVWKLADLEREGYDQKTCRSEFSARELDEDDPLFILYTSGTTGAPKGALYSHKMLFWNSVNTSFRIDLTSEDRTLTFLPLFHTGGLNVVATPFLHRGAFVTLVKKFDAELVTRLLEEEAITIFMGVPTTLKMMAESSAFQTISVKTVRFAMVGGEPMPLPLIETWHEKGVWIRQGFGMTEVGPNLFSLHQDDAVRKIGSIGMPNFYVDARVVDDDGNDVKRGEVGELIFKGPVVTKGYWKNPEATKAAFKDGWFYTGDLVRQDEEGYFYVVDRKKSMFISGGENVYPAEIEKVLYKHSAVAEVAVIGVPDEKWGEVGKACVVLKPGASASAEELKAFCLERLAKYKVPKHFEFYEALPKNDAGKINKKVLLQQRRSL
ncbi:MAG: o-succinylbenzoate--CoA ligase [Chloroherpetonaceae bacterium]|nr:o-succinylbenzoate--CoA ligase [Chloroherpetonaceae bacterium]MDW8437806.1 o-succinylbenzoate--CoA ligase [Chloroherpetonaceae bacterium]